MHLHYPAWLFSLRALSLSMLTHKIYYSILSYWEQTQKIVPLQEVNFLSQNESAHISLPSIQGRLSQNSSSLKTFLTFFCAMCTYLYWQLLCRFQQSKFLTVTSNVQSSALGKILSNHRKLASWASNCKNKRLSNFQFLLVWRNANQSIFSFLII